MVMEVLGTDFTEAQLKDIPNEGSYISSLDNIVKTDQGHILEEPIKFGVMDGMHEANGLTKSELDHAANANFPKDAVDDWPAPKQTHTFYFVKFRSHEDPKIKLKIEQADKEIQKTNQARYQITEALKAKRSERSHVISQLKPLTSEDKRYRTILDEKRRELEPLNAALGKLRGPKNAMTEKGVVICSSEEELDGLIQSLHYRMQHESNTLVEEKQLLKYIKQLENTRDKVMANVAMRSKIQESVGLPEEIKEQVKLMSDDLTGARKEKDVVREKIKNLEAELKTIDEEIGSLQEDLAAVNQKREKAYEMLNEVRKARDDKNACYYQNRSFLNNARDLAVKKDVAALKELCQIETEKFITQWCGDKAFRDDYEKRILPSLDSRQLSRDGRMRNPGEKPIIVETAMSVESETTVAKGFTKRPFEDIKKPVQRDAITAENTLNGEVETKKKVSAVEEVPNFSPSEKSPEEPSKTKEIDAAKLKEIKREEEIAKAKLALERKKRLAEKAAAKAAVRAQKEAEKKLKEMEKRAKKKAATVDPASAEEQVEVETMIDEPEEPEIKDSPVPSKTREQKENVKYRNRRRGSDQPPKIRLKKKKAHSYWLWAAPIVAVVLLLLMLGCYYYFGSN